MTGALSMFLNLHVADPYRCMGAPRGQCRRTGLPHQVLRGQDSTGIFHTKHAEKYPHKFGRFLAPAFDNYWIQQIRDSFGHYVSG